MELDILDMSTPLIRVSDCGAEIDRDAVGVLVILCIRRTPREGADGVKNRMGSGMN